MSRIASRRLVVLLAVVAGLAWASLAPAVPYVYIDTTAGEPTWNRPVAGNPPTPPASLVGTNVPYHTFEFAVTLSGAYDFNSIAMEPLGWDNYTFLYRNAFNPAQPFTNIIIGNDDRSAIGRSGFITTLSAGTPYILVTTGFDNSSYGRFENTINGPGGVVPGPGVAPEPLTGLLGLFALAGTALVAGTRRRHA